MFLSTLVVLSLMQADRQPSLVIDLPLASAACPDDVLWGERVPGRGEGTNAVDQVPALMWATLSVREDYSPKAPLDYEVTLTNFGDEPLRVPVLPRGAVCDGLRQKERGMIEARIVLRSRSKASRHRVVDAVSLWATSSRKDSQRVLAPDEKALIRVSRTWGTLAFSGEVPEELQLFVHIEGVSRRPIESSGSVVVQVRPGQR